MSLRVKALVALGLVPAFLLLALGVLRACGLLRPFSVPTGAMTPAVSAGDHIMMENLSYASRQPHRGDIVVFKTDGIERIPPPAAIFLKRVAGEPGDRVRITDGKLFINEKQISLSNDVGEIAYTLPSAFAGSFAAKTEVEVPPASYFVLGDNSTNSSDSRFWGTVPRQNIIGRVWFCYWPVSRFGKVK